MTETNNEQPTVDLDWWRAKFDPLGCAVVGWTYKNHCQIKLPSGKFLSIDQPTLELLECATSKNKEFKNLEAFSKGREQPHKDVTTFIGQPTAQDEGPDLSKATLFCDGASRIYIPQRFAQEVKRECVTGVSEDDYKILEAGPNHEHYWDAWAGVLDNATINDPKLGECYLYQDGDLWVVPVEKDVVVLGHKFKPFNKTDWYAFGGAEKDSLICYLDDGRTVLIWSPTTKILAEITDDGNHQRDWTFTVIL